MATFHTPHPAGPFAALARRILDHVLPRCCLLCGAPAGPSNLCARCADSMPRLSGPCIQCALPGPFTGSRCGACIRRPPRFRYALAGLLYAWPVDHLVRQFKFRRNLAAGATLGVELARAASGSLLPRPDALVPVPLHFFRRAVRGFNQAELLAREAGKMLAVPVRTGLLARSRHTPAQSGLDITDRRRNLRGAFRCRPATGLHLALVDDVFTTGTTLNECARALLAAGAATVDVWVAARVPAPGQARI